MNASGATGHLDVGGVFDATAEIYKRCFGTVWIVALILLIPSAIIQALVGDLIFGLIGSLVSIAASAWLAGSVVRIVQDVETDGTVDMSVGELLGSVWPRLIPIILLQIVVGILTAIGFFLLIIPGVILTLMWVVSLPALIVEEGGVFDSMSRSSDLTRDNRMRILWIGIMILAAYIVIALVGAVLVAAVPVLGVILLIILGVLLYPYIAIISTVLYYRLRDLKEGVVMEVEETFVVEEEPPPAV
ncbi:MAG TPA: hypothetical protein VMF31_00970 [Solirubrobacterales bacterium]|nr:hypothetical protein [Solirubrobacterales bacterium]